jgi:hypothetical protein
MKTPREVLLQRHQAADAKLDQIRSAVVAQIRPTPPPRSEWLPVRALFTGWRELIWPARRIWTGLATAWLFILIANASVSGAGHQNSARTVGRSTDPWLTISEQNQLLAELVGATSPKAVEPRIRSSPRPRSDVARKSLMT